jgi:hypothetical protein
MARVIRDFPDIDKVRDSHDNLPPNWEGELPPCATREELRTQMAFAFKQRNLTDSQIEEALDFFEEFEKRYYEVIETGITYHRACGGGTMFQGLMGVFCAKCGKPLDIFLPTFMF